MQPRSGSASELSAEMTTVTSQAKFTPKTAIEQQSHKATKF
jgi:hypothetical protein